jgi:DTW domain-containing protein YfiP
MQVLTGLLACLERRVTQVDQEVTGCLETEENQEMLALLEHPANVAERENLVFPEVLELQEKEVSPDPLNNDVAVS